MSAFMWVCVCVCVYVFCEIQRNVPFPSLYKLYFGKLYCRVEMVSSFGSLTSLSLTAGPDDLYWTSENEGQIRQRQGKKREL